MSLVERILGAEAGTHVQVPIDLLVTDDWTTPALLEPLEKMGVTRSVVPIAFVRDHTRPSTEYAHVREREKVEGNERIMQVFIERYKARLIEAGIQHYAVSESDLITPGDVVLGNDSHASTLGAYGLYAQAGQPTTIAAAMRTGYLPITVPETIGVELTGALADGVSARDAMLALLRRLAHEDATGKVIEYSGEGLERLSMHERAVLANLAPEAGARSAIFPIDRIAQAYYRERNVDAQLSEPSDLETRIGFSLSDVTPSVARSGSASNAVPIDGSARTRVDQVFVGTCAGGTYEEIRAFAESLRGYELADGMRAIVAPASRNIKGELSREGVLEQLERQGVTILEPGCGPCFGFGPGRLGEGEVGVSTGNRNAPGRMGRGSHVHLVSGRSAGVVARTGFLSYAAEQDTGDRSGVSITYPSTGNVIRIDGHVTTDDITPSYVPRVGSSSDTDRRTLRRLLFHYIDPDFADRDLSDTVIIAPGGFGYGSNRASSVRALKNAGVSAVISPRIAPLYADGARDEGFAALMVADNAFYDSITPDSNVTIGLEAGTASIGTARFDIALSNYDRDVLRAGGIIDYHNHEAYA